LKEIQVQAEFLDATFIGTGEYFEAIFLGELIGLDFIYFIN
jgi:hypothetical protein